MCYVCIVITRKMVDVMSLSINETLLNEICLINFSNHRLIGKVVKIYPDKFAVSLYEANHTALQVSDKAEIRIDTPHDKSYFFIAILESKHVIANDNIIFFKPLSAKEQENRRKYKRLTIDNYLNKTMVTYRDFPPIDKQWEKAQLVDISQGGLQMITNHVISTNQLLEIQIGQPFIKSSEIIISRVVNYKKESSTQFLLSIQFLTLSDLHKDEIEAYIQRVLDNTSNRMG